MDVVVEAEAVVEARWVILSCLRVWVRVVLDLVVGASRHGLGDTRPSVAPLGVEVHHEALLVGAHRAALEVRVQVVHPPEPAALPRAVETCESSKRSNTVPTGGEQAC